MGRVDINGFIAAGIALIAIIILFIAMFSNSWYNWEIDHTIEYKSGYYSFPDNPIVKETMEFNFGLSEAEFSEDEGRFGTRTVSREYDDMKDDDDMDDMIDAFGLVKILLIVGIVLAFIFLVLSILSGLRLIPGRIASITGIICFLAIIIGPITLIFNLPDAMRPFADVFDDDLGLWDMPAYGFWGSDTESHEFRNEYEYEDMGTTGVSVFLITPNDSWGPGWPWYLSLGMGVMILFGTFMCSSITRRDYKWDEDDPGDEYVEYDEEDGDDEELNVLEKLQRKQQKERESRRAPARVIPERSLGISPVSDERIGNKCVKCGAALVDPKSVFCPYCGTDQNSKEQVSASVQMNRCIDCGSPVQPPLIFCDPCVMKQNQATIPSDPASQPITGRYVQQQQASNIIVTQQRYAPVPTQPASPQFIQQVQLPVQPMAQQGYVHQQQVPPPAPMFPPVQKQDPPAPPPPAPPVYGGLQ